MQRKLADITEFLRSLKNSSMSIPSLEHSVQNHNGAAVEVAVTILIPARDISAHKTTEHSKRLESRPKIQKKNRDEERIAVMQELAPFVDFLTHVIVFNRAPGAESSYLRSSTSTHPG